MQVTGLFINVKASLSGRVQRVVVDGVLSEDVRGVSDVLQGSGLSISLFLLYTSDPLKILGNTFVDYADNITWLTEITHLGNRVYAASFLNHNLA